MADFNDVVRHVILRIVVDQAGLAEELAAARAKLKGLKDAEKESNKERRKDADEVTKAYQKQNDALGENQRAHEAAQRSSAGKSNKATDAVKAETEAIKANTQQRESQTIAEAKANAIDVKSHQDKLDRIKQRSAAVKRAEEELQRAAAKTQQAQEATRNTRLGGQSSRRARTTESAAKIDRQDTTAAASVARQDLNADAGRVRAAQESLDRIDRARIASAQKLAQAEQTHDTRHSALVARNQQSATTQALADIAKVAAAQARADDARHKAADSTSLRDNTYQDRETAISQTAQSKTVVAQQRAEGATSIAEGQQARAEATRNKTASEARLAATKEQAAEEKKVSDQQTRQIRNQSLLANLQTTAAKAATGQNILEQRLAETAERRARATEREAKAARGRRGLVDIAGSVVADTAVTGLRSVLSAPGKFRRAEVPDVSSQEESFRRVTTLAGRAETAVSQFFRRFTGDGEKSLRALGGFHARFKAVIADLNRTRLGGSGAGVLSDLAQNFTQLGQKLSGSLSSAQRHIFSFQTVIIAVIAALGPLAATLGAVGAAALGLVSNIGALSGSLLALPGILGAVVGGFGALALVMKPITSVFSAYTAAQKEATKATEAAKTSALALREARLNEAEAELAYHRAVQDVPRAQQKLSDARKQAARDIQDYRLQLQKLKYDEEGASLGVESAQLEYRKALVDPTKTNLDRRIARHDVEGSLYDQRDQGVASGRLLQDSSEAFKKGVDGSDAVVEAQRAVVDATNDVTASYINWQQAIIATQKAATEDKAGGAAAAALQAEIDKLPPKTKKVVLALLDLKDAYKSMRDRLSENIFGGISGETDKFADVLKSLEAFLGPVSVAVGTFAKRALDLFTNPDWKKFFSEQGEESGYIIGQLGDALLSTADAFRSITEVARPFTRYVVDGIKGMAQAFQGFTTSDEGRKKIGDFLALTRRRMSELKPILSDFVGGLLGFFAALNSKGPSGEQDFTSWMNKGLGDAMKRFKELGDLARDPKGGFQTWLRDVRPLLSQVGQFLKAVGVFFGDMFSDTKNMSEAKELLKQIGDKWLPAIYEIFSKLSESGFISKLAGAISAVFAGINDFLDNGGVSALGAFASAIQATGQVFSFLVGIVDKLTTAMPFLGTAFKAVGTVIGLFFGAALLARLSGLVPLIAGIGKAIKGVGNIAGSVFDPDDKRPRSRFARIGDAVRGRADSTKDDLLGRNSGESAARRIERDAAKGKGQPLPTPGTAGGTPTLGSRTNTGSVLTTLYRIEKWVEQVAVNTRGGVGGRGTGSAGVGPDGNPRNGPKGGPGSGGPSNRPKYTAADNDPRSSGFGSVGPEVVSAGVDPNSAEGRRQRREAASAARHAREGLRTTPTLRNDARATTAIADDLLSTPRTPRTSRLRGRFGKLGSTLLGGLSLFGASSVGVPDIPDVQPVQRGVPPLGVPDDDSAAPQSRTRRLLNRITGKLGNEEGYLDLGRGPDLDTVTAGLNGDTRRRGVNADVDIDQGTRRGLGEVEQRATRAGRLGRAGRGIGTIARGAGTGVGRLLGGSARGLGRAAGGLARAGGGLLRGAAGGLGGIAASVALSLGGDALINKFVKNDDDANSLSGGLTNVATGAGFGAMLGGPIGAALGGAAGGIYSLATDKNLRGFVGDKLKGGAKAVGGFVSKTGSTIGNFFGGGGKDEGKGGGISGALKGLASGGLVGALLGGTDLGQAILGSLKKAGSGIGKFFTKDIPGWFNQGIKAVTNFFTHTLPSLPKKAVNGFAFLVGYLIGFFTERLPAAAEAAWKGITGFFTKTLPAAAAAAWAGITGFFTETLPAAAQAAWGGITGFFTDTLPAAANAVWSSITGFFTDTLPNAAEAAWKGITGFFTDTLPGVFHTVVDDISTFFGTTLPNFFTETLPSAIESVPGMIYDNLVKPVLDFFSGLGSHIGDIVKGSWNWVTGLFSGAGKSLNAGKDAGAGTATKRMSGGLIDGVYQGIEDTVNLLATPGEFYVRKSVVDQPGAKAFLRDFNEGRVDMSSLYAGLSASTAPQVMSMVPPEAQALTGKVPTVVNTTINHAPLMGDVTIHNPVRERSEHSLRRQVQIANIRHRR